LVNAEKQLKIKNITLDPNIYFSELKTSAYIEDDHKPFQAAGVPILHLIPEHFPRVWHTTFDDESALNNNTIVDLCNILLQALQKWPGLLV